MPLYSHQRMNISVLFIKFKGELAHLLQDSMRTTDSLARTVFRKSVRDVIFSTLGKFNVDTHHKRAG